MNRESKLIFEAYRRVNEQQEWTNMDEWIKYFSQPSISNAPVSFKTETADGTGMSYGGNVTINDIIGKAKVRLNALGRNPEDKQNVLSQTANALQDYISGSKQLDSQTVNDLMDEFAKLDNVEKFVNAYNVTQQPTQQVAQTKPLPGHGPAITQAQKDAEQFTAVGDDSAPAISSEDMDKLNAQAKKIMGLMNKEFAGKTISTQN